MDTALDVPTNVHGLLASRPHLGGAEAGPRAVRSIYPTFHPAEDEVVPQVVHYFSVRLNLHRASRRAALPSALCLDFRVKETDFLLLVDSRPFLRAAREDSKLQGFSD